MDSEVGKVQREEIVLANGYIRRRKPNGVQYNSTSTISPQINPKKYYSFKSSDKPRRKPGAID